MRLMFENNLIHTAHVLEKERKELTDKICKLTIEHSLAKDKIQREQTQTQCVTDDLNNTKIRLERLNNELKELNLKLLTSNSEK
eukprot:UN21428